MNKEQMTINSASAPEASDPKPEVLKGVEMCNMGLEFSNSGEDGVECTITSRINPSLGEKEKEELNKLFKETALTLKGSLSKSLPNLRFSISGNFLGFYGEGQTVGSIRPALRFHISDLAKAEERKQAIQQITTLAKEQGLKI